MKIVYTMSEAVQIRNETGTSERSRCRCGGWLAHWEALSRVAADKCSVEGCNRAGEVGAHVTRPSAKNLDYQTHSYIVPMCLEHNGSYGSTFKSKPGVTFVWANVQETCGKL